VEIFVNLHTVEQTQSRGQCFPHRWAVQARADYLGVRAHGWAPGSKRGVLRRNPYWPVPLLSMFAVPRRPNFAVSAALLVGTIVLFVRRRCYAPRERESLIELARPPSVSPRSL
jgi:hypothetical protein